MIGPIEFQPNEELAERRVGSNYRRVTYLQHAGRFAVPLVKEQTGTERRCALHAKSLGHQGNQLPFIARVAVKCDALNVVLLVEIVG